jgi:hypothetical protein
MWSAGGAFGFIRQSKKVAEAACYSYAQMLGPGFELGAAQSGGLFELGAEGTEGPSSNWGADHIFWCFSLFGEAEPDTRR